MSSVRYPGCEVTLSSTDANANAIIARVRLALNRYLRDVEERDTGIIVAELEKFTTEATSGDYENVLATCLRWVTVS